MLSELIKFCKRLLRWIKTEELFLVAIIVLVAAISFGLGRLSKIREEKTPITIKNSSQPATFTVNAEKIFVASKNGKKYYYAWCDSAQKIKESNRVWFSAKEEAEKAGYEPAANCKGLK